jgi:hypothetical protein
MEEICLPLIQRWASSSGHELEAKITFDGAKIDEKMFTVILNRLKSSDVLKGPEKMSKYFIDPNIGPGFNSTIDIFYIDGAQHDVRVSKKSWDSVPLSKTRKTPQQRFTCKFVERNKRSMIVALTLTEEKPVPTFVEHKDKIALIRMKERTTFEAQAYGVRIDMTRVREAETLFFVGSSPYKYEIEVECNENIRTRDVALRHPHVMLNNILYICYKYIGDLTDSEIVCV